MADWRALFGPGGPHHPGGGERLVACLRPGMELVVSPGKSVAELGVIGRAEEMHSILDAETAATLEYLNRVTREQGGRRGRAQVRTPTGGLTWAVSRHATTRSGDPQPHDHVLVANVVRMGDERGGWKGLDTGLFRDHLHAATAVGRMAAAAKAVELGYGIEADPGPSGRLGGWAIAGIPGKPGRSTPTGRPRSTKPSALMLPTRPGRWRPAPPGTEKSTSRGRPPAPLAGTSWPGPVTRPPSWAPPSSGPASPTSRRAWTSSTHCRRAARPGGRLAAEKTFTCGDVIVAVAPMLHGLPVSVLDSAVEKVLPTSRHVALPPVAGAREPVWAAAWCSKTSGESPRSPTAGRADVTAVPDLVGRLGVRRNRSSPRRPSQRETGRGGQGPSHLGALPRPGRRGGRVGEDDHPFGGAGRVRGGRLQGHRDRHLGPSGQDAGRGCRYRLSDGGVAHLAPRHHQEVLGPRHVLVLDESGMTSDADMGKLLGRGQSLGRQTHHRGRLPPARRRRPGRRPGSPVRPSPRARLGPHGQPPPA